MTTEPAKPRFSQTATATRITEFGSGIVHIDGKVHDKLRQEAKDERQDRRLEKMGLWVTRIRNEDVEEIMKELEKHRIQIDAYGERSQ